MNKPCHDNKMLQHEGKHKHAMNLSELDLLPACRGILKLDMYQKDFKSEHYFGNLAQINLSKLSMNHNAANFICTVTDNQNKNSGLTPGLTHVYVGLFSFR